MNRRYCRRAFDRLFATGKAQAAFAELLPAFAKEQASPEVLAAFSISWRAGKDRRWDGCAKGKGDIFPYWDTRFGVRLAYESRTVACIGFAPKGRTIVIEQVQGRRGEESPLSAVRWERLLIALLAELVGGLYWYREVAVRPAERCWYWRRFSDNHFNNEHNARLKHRYDGTAKRMKFRWNPERDLWVKPTAA